VCGAVRHLLASPLVRGLIIRYRRVVRPRRVRVHGVVVAVDRGWPRAIVGTLYDGRYEQYEAQVLRATLRPGDRYLEVHPDRIGVAAVQDLMTHLVDQGFVLDTHLLGVQVLFGSREPR